MWQALHWRKTFSPASTSAGSGSAAVCSSAGAAASSTESSSETAEPDGFSSSSGVTSRTAARMVISTLSLQFSMQGGPSSETRGMSGLGSSKKLPSFGSVISVKFSRSSSNSSSSTT